jgi:hypothetical protein
MILKLTLTGLTHEFRTQVLPCPDRHLFIMFMSVVQVRQMFV